MWSGDVAFVQDELHVFYIFFRRLQCCDSIVPRPASNIFCYNNFLGWCTAPFREFFLNTLRVVCLCSSFVSVVDTDLFRAESCFVVLLFMQ